MVVGYVGKIEDEFVFLVLIVYGLVIFGIVFRKLYVIESLKVVFFIF